MFDRKRILTGIALAVFVVLFVVYAPLVIFKILILIAAAVGLREFMMIALPKHRSSSPYLGVWMGVFFSAVMLFAKGGSDLWTGSLTLVLVVSFAYYLFAAHDLTLVLSQVALTVFGIIYVGCLLSYAGLIRGLDRGVFWIFLLAGTTFTADAAAYFVGHWFGRHKLAPRVSPGKTVEGLIGGIAGSLLAVFVCKTLLWSDFRIRDCWILGIMIGLIGPLGDLSESLIKRSVGVKDSGQLIPGHGGLLDRIDALLFTAPFVYYYATYVY